MMLVGEKDRMREILKEYFQDLYNIGTEERVIFNICCLNGERKGNFWLTPN